MKGKIFNRMFMDAEYSFSMLKFYYEHMVASLNRSSKDDQEFIQRLEISYKQKQREFDKQHWQKQHTIYTEIYPGFFNNSFLISACALFEYHIKKICALVKEEHRVPLEWDDMSGSVPTRAKSFLWHGGILLKDDSSGSFQYLLSSSILGRKMLTVKGLWQELENYFRVRNCIAHQNGFVQKLRYPDKIMKYANERGILVNKAGQLELLLNQGFNIEVCDTMSKFYERLMSTYYSTPLPE